MDMNTVMMLRAEQEPGDAEREQDRAQNQIPGKRDAACMHQSISFRARTIAPRIAIRIRTEVTSKGSRYVGEQRASDLARRAARETAEVHRRRAAADMRWTKYADQPEKRDQQRHAEQSGDHERRPLLRLRAGVQQHDDEDEQHHDGARVDDHLRRRDELRAQQQVQHRERAHHADQRERARDRMRLHHHVDARTPPRSTAKMRKRMTSIYLASTSATRKPVTSRFNTATGNRNFQAKRISWS